jgi:hypothetical protein
MHAQIRGEGVRELRSDLGLRRDMEVRIWLL